MTVLMFPDFQGEGARGKFGAALMKHYPGARLVPILNGFDQEQLRGIAETLPDIFEPVLSEAHGVFEALRAGYSHVFAKYPQASVVRLDTDEHPIQLISSLQKRAEELTGMVVGDLSFGPKTLRAGSIDEFVNLNLFPNLYQHFTSGRLLLSGAYGFQAFAPGVGSTILAAAERVAGEAEREVGRAFQWGFDAAMILGALASNVPVEVIKVPAESLRDRDREKITRQLEDTLAICCAANRLFHLADTVPHQNSKLI